MTTHLAYGAVIALITSVMLARDAHGSTLPLDAADYFAAAGMAFFVATITVLVVARFVGAP